ncbi:MAG: TlpA family protein disulfide reductase [Thermoanaerobaculia bacterium]
MSPARAAAAAALLLVGAAAARAGTLKPVTHDEWQAALAAHRGEIVVVDYWATWCLPCLERFPKMVELAERHAADAVTFIAFALDDIEDPGAMRQAEAFVREQGGRIEHYVTTEEIPVAFERLGLLGIPAVHLYRRDGTHAEKLTSDDPNAQFTDEDVARAVTELLAAEPPSGQP